MELEAHCLLDKAYERRKDKAAKGEASPFAALSFLLSKK